MIKKLLWGILVAALMYLFFCGNNYSAADWRDEAIAKERVAALPDCVYEHIVNNVGDNANDIEIMEYYYSHEMECLEIEAQNELNNYEYYSER